MDVVPASARIPGLQTEALARLWRELGSQAGQILPELIDTALQSMPGVLEDAYDALARDHADDLGRAAHTLKSNAAWFGLSALEVRCRDIELRADRGELVGLRERLDRVSVELDEARRLLSLLRESVLPAPPRS